MGLDSQLETLLYCTFAISRAAVWTYQWQWNPLDWALRYISVLWIAKTTTVVIIFIQMIYKLVCELLWCIPYSDRGDAQNSYLWYLLYIESTSFCTLHPQSMDRFSESQGNNVIVIYTIGNTVQYWFTMKVLNKNPRQCIISLCLNGLTNITTCWAHGNSATWNIPEGCPVNLLY